MKKSMARVLAALEGRATYIPESPCARGHLLRITAGGSCIECRRMKEKERYHKDPAKTKKRTSKKYYANVEHSRAVHNTFHHKNKSVLNSLARVRSAEWRLKNPDHAGTKVSKKAYKIANPGKTRAHVAQRRAAKMQRTPAWLTPDDFWLIEQAYDLAILRTQMFGFSWHVDHIIPLQGKYVSGFHVPCNLQVIPGTENIRKANKHLPA